MNTLQNPSSDINVWGAIHNDFHRTLSGGYEYIELLKNANNPPTIVAGTRFSKYALDGGYTPDSQVPTGNTVYPKGVSITCLLSEGIWEPTNRTFTWNTADTAGGETLPAQSDGIWYIICKGSSDVSSSYIGKGRYNLSKTETPTYSHEKGGWYSSSGYRVIGRFVSTSGTISELATFNAGHTKERGYIDHDISITGTTQVSVNGLSLDLNGSLVSYNENILFAAGSGAAAWYAILVAEGTGAVSMATTAFPSAGYYLIDFYDTTKKYCVITTYRLIGMAYWSGTAWTRTIKIPSGRPKSFAHYESNAGQTIGSASLTIIDYEDFVSDYNGEVTTGATWKFTAKTPGIFLVNASTEIASTTGWGVAEYVFIGLYTNGVLHRVLNRTYFQAAATVETPVYGSGQIELQEGDYIDIRLYQTNGGNVSLSGTTQVTLVTIKQL